MKVRRILILIIFIIIIYLIFNYYRVKNAKIIVRLKDNLQAEVFSDVKVSDYIEKINGKLISDKKIDTKKIGTKNVTFDFINNDNIKVSYSFDIEIIDSTPPLISGKSFLTLYEGYDRDIFDNFLCGDNYDDNVKCQIVGSYDVNSVGSYNVTCEAIDSSNNKSSKDLTINVVKKESDSALNSRDYTYFKDVIEKYKTRTNKIGIDVSKWEGDIDFKKIKDQGAEFVYIRLGHQKGLKGEYIIDPKFKQNILGFKKQKIKVGVYFFSQADDIFEAIKQAKWVVKQLKNEKIDLEVVFDWENWNGYNKYGLSFYHLSQTAEAFMNYIEEKGYKPMLYSSKYYLENVWFKTNRDVWLAHYADNTDYSGRYKVWQLCENGKIDGIDDMVDIDIMYEVW